MKQSIEDKNASSKSKQEMYRDQFFKWESECRKEENRSGVNFDLIVARGVYIDVVEDLGAGLVLSKILYWNLPAKNGQPTKLKVTFNGELWLAKSREEWFDELRLTPPQVDRAFKLLEKKNLIRREVHKFAGRPVSYIQVNWVTLHKRLVVVTNAGYVNPKRPPSRKETDSNKAALPDDEQVSDVAESATSMLQKVQHLDVTESATTRCDGNHNNCTESTAQVTSKGFYKEPELNIQEGVPERHDTSPDQEPAYLVTSSLPGTRIDVRGEYMDTVYDSVFEFDESDPFADDPSSSVTRGDTGPYKAVSGQYPTNC